MGYALLERLTSLTSRLASGSAASAVPLACWWRERLEDAGIRVVLVLIVEAVAPLHVALADVDAGSGSTGGAGG